MAGPLVASDYDVPPPMRPLPQVSSRPLAEGARKFVDPAKGNDANDGSETKPWRTLGFAVTKLAPGDTLLLRGGVYREHVTATCAGTREKPITIRSHPGELAVLDGGLAEFQEAPQSAWEPYPDGAPGEYRSTKAYENAGNATSDGQTETTVLGSFADSMVPLQGGHTMGDLRSTNMFWNLDKKSGPETFLYAGPTICYDVTTKRIHARFAHTTLKGLGEDNYRGETDPRQLRLVIATMNAGSVLTLRDARYVRVQDIVARGARMPTIDVDGCAAISFEGVTSYGGASAMRVQGTRGLRLTNCALRGIAAPWTFRSNLKYRSIEARIFAASAWTPSGADNEDFEIAHCEFTDSVDGVFIGNVRGVNFHHNLVDNISDDGMFLTCGTAADGRTQGGNVHLWQNLFSRCLTTFAFGVGHGRQKMLATGRQTGAGVWAHNNVFDLRRWVAYFQPHNADEPQDLSFTGRMCGDHGSPAWEPMYFYHNTILTTADPFRGAYLGGIAGAVSPGSPRRVLNNILVQSTGTPGTVFQEKNPDLIADGNLHWSAASGSATQAEEFLRKLRGSRVALESKTRYAPGWGAQDQYADPRWAKLATNPAEACDARLQPQSPAINAAVPVPAEWPAPLRSISTRGDLGAIPAGAQPWRVGVNGRLDAFGQKLEPSADVARSILALPDVPARPKAAKKPVALVEGYPAFDAPLLLHALRKNGALIEHLEKGWLDTSRWPEFSVVAFAGSLSRAKAPVSKFSAEDLPRVRAFLDQGGVVLLLRGTGEMFSSPHGQAFLKELCGNPPRPPAAPAQVLIPKHPWIAHLDSATVPSWITTKATAPLWITNGERVFGTAEGLTLLGRVPVGRGAIVYVGWDVAASMPGGRGASTPEMEREYEDQYLILEKIVSAAIGN